jgi:hypothetical protein
MNDKLKRFCHEAEFISVTLDISTDRRMRAFYAMTGKFQSFSRVLIFSIDAIY